MKCIVTGGAGFIGSNLAEELVNRGNQVMIIDDLSTGSLKNIESFKHKTDFIEGSILDLGLLRKISKNCEVIFHQAAIPSVTRSIANPKATSEVNIMGALNVLIAAKESNSKVIFASSSSVYGDTKELPKRESIEPKPESIYALSKHASEQFCRLFHKFYGLETVCLRYFNVFGPRQDPYSEYAAVIPKFITSIISGKSTVVFGNGNQTRDFTYVKNVVSANILAANSRIKDGRPINIACQRRITINELLALIGKLLKKNAHPEYKDARPGDIRDSLADISAAKELLGYNPDFNLEQGLKETIDWFKKDWNLKE